MRALLLLCILAGVLSACGPDHDSLSGHYTAHQGKKVAVTLELEDDGNGFWTVNPEEGGVAIPFAWSRTGNKVVLRTKTGSMVAGERQGDAIILQLPGVEPLTFLPRRQ